MSAQTVDTFSPDDLVIDLSERVQPTPLRVTTLDLELPAAVYVRFLKPTIDRVVAVALILLLIPTFATIAVVVRVQLGGGVLYRQERVGRGGTRFSVYKFRTMRPDRRTTPLPFAGADRRLTHKTIDDPRHTDLGRFLRRWSLDELPQLFNVLRGDMSIVGPRPELPHIVDRYQPWEHARHAVRPGLTGFWQTTRRGDGPMAQHTALDVDYVRTASARVDLLVLLKTIPALVSQPGS